MITGIDHFIVLVNDLGAAMENYRRLGFEVRAGGEHPAFGSHNALIALADATYIELVAFKDTALAAQTFWGNAVKKLHVREGFGGYALSSNDLVNDVAEIRRRRLDIAEPRAGSRTRPDGRQVEWRTAVIGGTPVDTLPFLIQDDTPRESRVEPAREGLGSRARVKEVIVAVKHVDIARDRYHALLGVEPRRVHNVAGDVQGLRIAMPWGAIVLAHPERGGNAMADQLSERGEGLYAVALVTEDINRERQEAARRGIAVEDDRYGFLIAPDAACGARIRLV